MSIEEDTREYEFMLVNGRTLDASSYDPLPFDLAEYADDEDCGVIKVEFFSEDFRDEGDLALDWNVIEVVHPDGTVIPLPTDLQAVIWGWAKELIREGM